MKKKKKNLTRRLRRSSSTERRELQIELDLLLTGSDRVSDKQKKTTKNKSKNTATNNQRTTSTNVLSLVQKTSQLLFIFDKQRGCRCYIRTQQEK